MVTAIYFRAFMVKKWYNINRVDSMKGWVSMEFNDKNTAALIEIIKEQIQQNASLLKKIEELNDDSKILREQIEYLTKKLFGRKSEKTEVLTGQIVIDGVLGNSQFDEAEADPFIEEPTIEKIKRTRKGYRREDALKNLPEEDLINTLPDEEKVCLIDNDQLKPVGKKYIRTEIKYTPATMKLVHIYNETWECRSCRKAGRDYLVQAKSNQPLLQHSMASPSSVAWAMYQKFVNHMPLYRQSKDWQNLGLEIQRSTLSNWITKTSEEWLSKVVKALHEKLLKEDFIHADETSFQVLKEPGRKNTTKSFMWIYATGIHNARPIRIFNYRSGRSGSYAADFLEGYQGSYLHSDAYQGYGKIQGITRVLCWSHVRRYYTDALPRDIKKPEATLPKEGIAYCNKIFEIEESLSELSADERKIQRLIQVKPVLEAFWVWVNTNIGKVLPKSKIGKALQYSLNQKNGLMTFLEDGNCEISNNLAENSIRPFTVGRRNWLFSGSPKGATASAVVYSLVETAKANGLNPYKYLEYLLTNLSKTDSQIDMDNMMPWDSTIQELCSHKIVKPLKNGIQ